MKNIVYLLLLSTLLTGCVSEKEGPKVERTPYGTSKKHANNKFEKLKNARLILITPTKRQFKAGEVAELSFALRNNGNNLVRIPEWRANESNNLKLFCQAWLPNTQEPDPTRWISLDEPPQGPEQRFQLDLRPDNQALITKKLEFVQDLVVSAGSERRYFIKAELNLTSCKAASEVFAIAISNQ